jgi:hypothetical protein
VGVEIDTFKMKAVIELFFERNQKAIHEISFVYTAQIDGEYELQEGQAEYTLEEIEKVDFYPEVIRQVMRLSDNGQVLHLIARE